MEVEIFEILINSKYAFIAIVLAIIGALIQLIRIIWRVVKENKIILSAMNDKSLTELTIDKTGAIFLKKSKEKTEKENSV